MSLLTELKVWLPTPVARWSALLTSILLPPSFLAPSFLQPLLAPKATEAEVILAQLLMPTLIVLFFAFATTISVIRAYHAKVKQHEIDLQQQRADLTSLASEEKKRNDEFTKPLKYDNRGIV